nr:immunoglobulin light chain junction region [Macaca mulatta]MOX51960.1 immunoglobulin light chain junction region [Macaca mulatta]MOX52592.1 immunoglobulin light chain junction region [Macaca mulatta]MOX54621.1 immunoglobulin light chain junction region [Macaca mulatta]MOX54679.1 immunoglobulin light chain junction region [Macaca mulatta]
CQQYQNWISF